MDDGSTARPPMEAPRLSAEPERSGRQVALVLGAMAVFFLLLVVLASWAAGNG